MSDGKKLAEKWLRGWVNDGLDARPDEQRRLIASIAARAVNNNPLMYEPGPMDSLEALRLLHERYPHA